MWLWIVFFIALGPFSEVVLSSLTCINISDKPVDNVTHKGSNTENDVGSEETVAVTKLADVFLMYIREKAKKEGYDPLKLKDLSVTYGIELYDGTAIGLSELKRLGDTLLSTRNDTVALTAAFQLPSARVFYKWKKSLWLLSLYGTLRVSVKKIAIFVQLQQKINTGEHPQLAKYTVLNVGNMVVDFSGLGFLDSSVIDKIKKEASEELSDVLHKQIPHIITKHLMEITL